MQFTFKDEVRESHFTPKQLELFQERYDNGYDLYTDPDYVMWMIDNHPTDVPRDGTEKES